MKESNCVCIYLSLYTYLPTMVVGGGGRGYTPRTKRNEMKTSLYNPSIVGSTNMPPWGEVITKVSLFNKRNSVCRSIAPTSSLLLDPYSAPIPYAMVLWSNKIEQFKKRMSSFFSYNSFRSKTLLRFMHEKLEAALRVQHKSVKYRNKDKEVAVYG